MHLNILYSCLIGGTPDIQRDNIWFKATTNCKMSSNAIDIKDSLVDTIPNGLRLPYACFICHGVLNSVFGPEIKVVDPMNTYSDPSMVLVPATPGVEWQGMALSEYFPSYDQLYDDVIQRVDSDIRDRMYGLNWYDLAGAACTQILRGVTLDGE